MNLSQYVLLFTLAEALAVTGVLAVVLGLKWWRLRQRAGRTLKAERMIKRLLRAEIAKQEDKPNPRPEVRTAHLACLKVLTLPYSEQRLDDEPTWTRVLSTFEQCFEALEQPSGARAGSRSAAPVDDSEPAQPGATPDSDPDSDPAPDDALDASASAALDAKMEALRGQYRRSISSLGADQETVAELRSKYAQLHEINQSLRSKLEALGQHDDTSELRQALEQAERCNLELMQAALGSKRNFNIMTQHCQALDDHVERLQTSIKGYRKSAHKLLLEREAHTEEIKALATQLEMRERLVERLNRNYKVLRDEYNRLHGVAP